jgi:hypothetical protein
LAPLPAACESKQNNQNGVCTIPHKEVLSGQPSRGAKDDNHHDNKSEKKIVEVDPAVFRSRTSAGGASRYF